MSNAATSIEAPATPSRPAALAAVPKSATEFAHALIHALEVDSRGERLRSVLERYGERGCRPVDNTQTAAGLESRWRMQLGLRRCWFENQVRNHILHGEQATANRRAALALIAESDGGVEAHHDCAHHASLSESRVHKGGCSHSHHQNERGLLMVDLDEAAHGVYASVKQTLPLFKGEGVSKVEQEFAEQTERLANDPLGWMAHDVPPAGVGDFSAAIGTAALVAPLAVIAVKAGLHETRDALAIRRELTARAASLETRRDALTRLLPATPGVALNTLAEAEHRLVDRAAQDTRFAMRINRLRLGIGVASAASGATIFLKTVIDVVLKSTLVASAKKLNVVQFVADHAAAGAAVTAAGVAGTLVLGPLAGIFATVLGGFFARKSALRHRAFRQDRARVEAFLRAASEPSEASGEVDPAVEKYRQFIDRKLPQRARFYRLFKRWNMTFLGGSSLYAASALTKAALGIAALAGAGALISNPVGWGILLGVGVVGAVVMGVASWQFLFGHPKNERYERYYREDHPELDRHFLAGVDILPRAQGSGALAGLGLRAKLFEQLERNAEVLDGIKTRVARKLGKKLKPGRADFLPDLAARMRALAAGARVWLRTASWRQALEYSQSVRSRRSRGLVEADIAAWIGSDDASTDWREFRERYLLAQRDYLENKLAFRLDLLERQPALVPENACTDEQAHKALAGLMADLDAAIERDQAALERIRLCLSLEPNSERADRALLGILTGVRASALDGLDAAAVRRELATTLMRDLPRRLRDAKGMLLETEMQAARLRASVATGLNP